MIGVLKNVNGHLNIKSSMGPIEWGVYIYIYSIHIHIHTYTHIYIICRQHWYLIYYLLVIHIYLYIHYILILLLLNDYLLLLLLFIIIIMIIIYWIYHIIYICYIPIISPWFHYQQSFIFRSATKKTPAPVVARCLCNWRASEEKRVGGESGWSNGY